MAIYYKKPLKKKKHRLETFKKIGLDILFIIGVVGILILIGGLTYM